MTGVDTRSVNRDSLFLLANVRLENDADPHRVRVRNLSDGGMMAEGKMFVRRGDRLEVELRNIGKIGASVAWVQDERFGIAFDREIDSRLARRPAAGGDNTAPGMADRLWTHRAPPSPDPSTLRKI